MKQLIGALAAMAVIVGGASAPTLAQTDVAVTILHGIPGVTVDLQVDGETVIAGFDAGDTQDFTPLAGTVLTNIQAVRAGGDEVVIGPIDSFTVPDEGNTSVVVHLDSAGEPTITPFVNTAPPSEQGRGLLTVRHVAAAPPVSVSIGDEDVIDGIGNGQEGSIVLPAGEVSDAWITLDGERIAPVPNLTLAANSQLVVYVGGSLEAQDLEFYLQQVSASGIETVPVARAQTDTDADTADAGDDGTPQPDVVNTGDAIDSASGNPIVFGAALALLALAAVTLVVRWRVLAGARAAMRSVSPWSAPSIEQLVRRSDTPQI